MSKKIMITGSCGLIGGSFIRKMIYEKQPYSISSLDKVDSNNPNSVYMHKNHAFQIANVCDPHIINTIFQFEQPEIVIHAAEESCNQELMISSNIQGTKSVIEACQKNNVQKIIYLSSDKVYGSSTHNTYREDEESNLNPNSLFAISKLSSELLIKNSGLNYNILRLSNNFGPRQAVSKLIPKTIKSILNNSEIQVSEQSRQWIHVNDTCDAIQTVIENGINNQIYNVSGGEYSNIEIVQKICNVMSSGHNLIKAVNLPGDRRRATNNELLKKLNWKLNQKFNDSIPFVVEWFQNNKWIMK